MEVHADAASAQLLSRAGIQTTQGVLSTKGRTAVDLQSHTSTYILEGQPPLGAPWGLSRSTDRDTGKSTATC